MGGRGLLGLAGLLLFLGFGGTLIAGTVHLLGKGSVHVIAPVDVEVTARVDSAEETRVPAGKHREIELTRGAHALRIDVEGAETKWDLSVSGGFYEVVAPVDDAQCFVLFDMGGYYGSKSDNGKARVRQRIHPKGPFKKPGSTWFAGAELPKSIDEGSSVNLLLDAPCDFLDKSDAELVRIYFEET